MVNFNYYAPTEILFGPNKEEEIANLIKAYNGKKVLIHYGQGSIEENGLLDKVTSVLNASSIDYYTLKGVVANPVLSKVEEGIDFVTENKIDFILAIGGGSVIDSAKAIAVGALNDFDFNKFVNRTDVNKALPVGVILTIAAAGSEMSPTAVITDEKTSLKRSFSGKAMRPVFAILNPELTYSVSPYQTACGAADIIMHTVERYFTEADTLDLTDKIAASLIQNVIKHSQTLLKNPNDYQARAEIMWSGSLSHNDLTSARSDRGDWAVHKLGHELTTAFDVAHGATLTAVWSFWAKYVYLNHKERFKKFAIEVMQVDTLNKDDGSIIIEGISKLNEYFYLMGLPTSIKGFNVKNSDIENMALLASNNKKSSIGVLEVLEYDDIVNIYRNANQ